MTIKEYKFKLMDKKGEIFERTGTAKNIKELKNKINKEYNIKGIKSIKLWRTWGTFEE